MDKKFCEFEHKVCYSRREANGKLNWFRKVTHRHGIRKKIPQRCYYCEHCGMYHLTSHKH